MVSTHLVRRLLGQYLQDENVTHGITIVTNRQKPSINQLRLMMNVLNILFDLTVMSITIAPLMICKMMTVLAITRVSSFVYSLLMFVTSSFFLYSLSDSFTLCFIFYFLFVTP